MYPAANSDFRWLNLQVQRHQVRTYYAARLHQRFGRSTIGLGSDEFTALVLARKLDGEIQRLVDAAEIIDLESLRTFVGELKPLLANSSKASLRIVRKDELSLLWKKYVDFHQALGAWEQTYINNEITHVSRLLEKCPFKRLEDKSEILQWILNDKKRSAATSKKRFMHLTAAVDWNSKQGNIPRRWGIEYRDVLGSVKISGKKKEKKKIDVYTVDEVYRILNALRDDTYSRFKGKHSQYYKYVYFLWLTGCRPSEAIALKWDNVNIARRIITFCEAQVLTSGGKIVSKDGTKTELLRTFPVNQELQILLESIPRQEGFVFTNEMGKPISQAALNTVWKTLLKSLEMRYRIPYNLRHTMISYHANNDFPIQKLAKLVGNSPEVIMQHYLHFDIERINLPGVVQESDMG
ncbi:site-specific integrase [Microcoleus sp. D2_18a_B4]|uniref:site-specific integrase n=1 Tax=Microcoleus sp. D2_18a_B4 TaxID=3055329 RepID=UPI002FD66EB8